MQRRSAETHAAFFTPLLRPGMRVLDCGCGPGAITRGFAALVAPGEVVGADREDSQIETARRLNAGAGNLRFQAASVYELPFDDASFDAAFSHALFEHLRDPLRALAELKRVLKPDAMIGLRAPDWGGFLIHPLTPPIGDAVRWYRAHQESNGGNTQMGRALHALLRQAGFARVRASASYEVYSDPQLIAGYLALQADQLGESHHAESLRAWCRDPDAFFAQAWGEAIGFLGKR